MASLRCICAAAALTVFVMGSTQGFASAPDHRVTETNATALASVATNTATSAAERSVSSIKLAAFDTYMVFVDDDGDYDDDWGF
jgi:hypothetical protein